MDHAIITVWERMLCGIGTPRRITICPCCGGRMIIIEVFARGATPRYRQVLQPASSGSTLMTASRSRKHDHRARWLSTSQGQTRSDIQLSSQIVRQFTTFDATRCSFTSCFTVAKPAASARPRSTSSLAAPKSPSVCGTAPTFLSAVSLGGFRTPAAEHAAPSLKQPASETLI